MLTDFLRGRNDPITRYNSVNQSSRANHHQWLSNMLRSSESDLQIAEGDGVAIGVVRFDWAPERDACVFIYRGARSSWGGLRVRHGSTLFRTFVTPG